MNPKVFISYSWSTSEHRLNIKSWADNLIKDGIDVVIDIYDLIEGQDKFAFMERMVTDTSISHVIIFSDKKYAVKANNRKDGVGTESQIISKEVYEKVNQSKFIPIVCEFNENGKPLLPTYLQSRIYIDFSTPEAVNNNWERLVRLIHGKPSDQKPTLGKPPAYITSEVQIPTSHIQLKLNLLKQIILQGKKGVSDYRNDFITACIDYADDLRIRENPSVPSLGAKVLEDACKLIPIRNYLVDWVLFESNTTTITEFNECLLEIFEKLVEVKSRPIELTSWYDTWFDAHSIFVYETFLYSIAALIKNKSYETLHELFTAYYLIPESERTGDELFQTFQTFWGHAESLQEVLAPEGKKLFGPSAEFLKKYADRSDLPFNTLIEADLLAFMMACLNPKVWWYPQTILYAPYTGGNYLLFGKATQHKYFLNLGIVTGINDANILRENVKEGLKRIVFKRAYFHNSDSIWRKLNMEKLDTLI